ncbi:MAG TPA: hypothetical protein VIQ81_01160 [Gammaproteobacteria bacterium]
MLIRILLISGLLAASFSASARDFENSYAVYGAGGDSCSTYLEAMEKGDRELDYFVDWVIGYFSAFNVIMPSTYDLLGETDFPTAQRWLERDCRRYPKQLFITAVIKLSEVLYPMRYQSGLKPGVAGAAPAAEPAAPSQEKTEAASQ